MDWKALLIGLSLGLWIALAAFLLHPTDTSEAPPACTAVCCGTCGGGGGGRPQRRGFVPQGSAAYFCGVSDQGGAFIWDQGGGWVWDQGGGWVWDQGGGWVWDQGGGWVWDAGTVSGPQAGSARVPVPLTGPDGTARGPRDYRCDAGSGGVNDVRVVTGRVLGGAAPGTPVTIVMANGNHEYQCIEQDGEPKVVPRDTPLPGGSTSRMYCQLIPGGQIELLDEPVWSEP